MSYASIDTLQKTLSNSVFNHTKDSKKAAGRALGTLVEIISYYFLHQWGLTHSLAIERGLAEYGNASITHNVEFTLHPILMQQTVSVENTSKTSVTANKLCKAVNIGDEYEGKVQTLLDKHQVLKNAAVIAENTTAMYVANLRQIAHTHTDIDITLLYKQPYAMFECKRVGIEEGAKKGPQTIEKAKQGAYVALNVSSLQKVWGEHGERLGLIYLDNEPIIKEYDQLICDIVNEDNRNMLKNFTLSVGIVSNHGNWFTAENQNKELKVLAQSYDWLLFLTDEGLAAFITDLLLSPKPQYIAVKEAFLNSYKEGKKTNAFTKSKIQCDAHIALQVYFKENINKIENWFNVITPVGENIQSLKGTLYTLKNKNWNDILK